MTLHIKFERNWSSGEQDYSKVCPILFTSSSLEIGINLTEWRAII